MKKNMQNKIVDLSKIPTKTKQMLDKVQARMKDEKKEKKEGLDLKVFIKDLVERKFGSKGEEESKS